MTSNNPSPETNQFHGGGGMQQHRWVRGPLLGRGSTATVSLATSSTTATFAVKSAEISHSALLQREQRFLSSLRSPHLISYSGFDLTEENGRTLFNLFMEYAPGGSLSDLFLTHNHNTLKEPQIRSYTRSILMALSHLHSNGIAHCDVKGRNVLIAADGYAKLADLGCARFVDDTCQPIGGTPLFMSPEAARGEEQGTPSDVWGLGCTIIEMATGRPPWSDVTDPISAIHRIGFSGETPEIPKWVSAEAEDFMRKCFERDPRRRWTADELLCHPFVSTVGSDESPDPDWRSPKCVLDQDFWESLQEDETESDGEEQATLTASDPSERIRQLASASEALTKSSELGSSLDEDDWITIRCHLSEGSSGEFSASPPRGTFLVDMAPVLPPINCGDNPCGITVNQIHFCHKQSYSGC